MYTHILQIVTTGFAASLSIVLKNCHHGIVCGSRTLRITVDGLDMLQRQIDGYDAVLRTHATAIKNSIDSTWKSINRVFIKKSMLPAYTACGDEHGFRTFQRMKEHMASHIAERRSSLFQDSVEEVRRRLLQLVREDQQLMADKVREVFHAVQRDYVSVLIGGDVPNAAKLRKARQQMRRQAMTVLDTTEEIFLKVAGLPKMSNNNGKEANGIYASLQIDLLEEDVNAKLHDMTVAVTVDAVETATQEKGVEAPIPGVQELTGSELSDLDLLDISEYWAAALGASFLIRQDMAQIRKIRSVASWTLTADDTMCDCFRHPTLTTNSSGFAASRQQHH